MNYKAVSFFFISLYSIPFLAGAQIRSHQVHLGGSLINFSNQVFIQDISAVKDMVTQDINRIIVPDNSGNFRIDFYLENAGYFRIGRNVLYLEPGDNLSMVIDYEYPENAIFNSPSGKSQEANEYLRLTPFPNAGSFLEAGLGIKETVELTIDGILIAAKKRENSLSGYRNVSSKFRSLEKARIRADILNSLYKIPSYFPYMHKMHEDTIPVFLKKCSDITETYITRYRKDFINTEFLNLEVYQRLILWWAGDSVMKASFSKQIMNWLEAESIAINISKVSQRNKLYAFIPEINNLKGQVYKRTLLKKIESLTAFNAGDTAREFFAADSSDKAIQFGQFRGKVIFIDLWATWCGPCLKEMPYLDTLRRRYGNNPEIVFLSVSIDENKELWKNFLQKRKPNGLQLISSRGALKDYNVLGIPRTIIIDRNFVVAAMNGPLPSSLNETTILLDKLLMK
jgi:thiol-disulfide isomerase/thioredoxin